MFCASILPSPLEPFWVFRGRRESASEYQHFQRLRMLDMLEIPPPPELFGASWREGENAGKCHWWYLQAFLPNLRCIPSMHGIFTPPWTQVRGNSSVHWENECQTLCSLHLKPSLPASTPTFCGSQQRRFQMVITIGQTGCQAPKMWSWDRELWHNLFLRRSWLRAVVEWTATGWGPPVEINLPAIST